MESYKIEGDIKMKHIIPAIILTGVIMTLTVFASSAPTEAALPA